MSAFGLPPNYQVYYFENSIPENWSQILKASDGFFTLREIVPYVDYEGALIKIKASYFPDKYKSDPYNIRKYITQAYPLIQKPDISSKTKEIRNNINAMLDGGSPILLVEEKVRHHFSPPQKLVQDQWMTVLYDLNNEMIAGIYYGEYNHKLSIAPSDNYLEIHPLYRKRGLCVPFTAFTYSKVLERVNTMEILNETVPGIVGCHCYSKAAEKMGAHIYVTGEEIHPDQCEVKEIEDTMTLTYATLPTAKRLKKSS